MIGGVYFEEDLCLSGDVYHGKSESEETRIKHCKRVKQLAKMDYASVLWKRWGVWRSYKKRRRLRYIRYRYGDSCTTLLVCIVFFVVLKASILRFQPFYSE